MEAASNVIQLDRVRCLECGAKYVKPADGGTVQENPGCPKCGYLGWISTKIPAIGDAPRRFVADRLRAPTARSR
jgi:predicted  nucleic acid-binding Zn-ribbon protein